MTVRWVCDQPAIAIHKRNRSKLALTLRRHSDWCNKESYVVTSFLMVTDIISLIIITFNQLWVELKHLTTTDLHINQPINQSINQSFNQSINQSINQSFNQSINQSINQPTQLYLPPHNILSQWSLSRIYTSLVAYPANIYCSTATITTHKSHYVHRKHSTFTPVWCSSNRSGAGRTCAHC